VPFGHVAEWLKLFKLLAYAPWFRAVTHYHYAITTATDMLLTIDHMELKAQNQDSPHQNAK
jgi:hypothetical protein